MTLSITHNGINKVGETLARAAGELITLKGFAGDAHVWAFGSELAMLRIYAKFANICSAPKFSENIGLWFIEWNRGKVEVEYDYNVDVSPVSGVSATDSLRQQSRAIDHVKKQIRRNYSDMKAAGELIVKWSVANDWPGMMFEDALTQEAKSIYFCRAE